MHSHPLYTEQMYPPPPPIRSHVSLISFERKEHAGTTKYAAVGLLSVCEHYAYRDSIRPRIRYEGTP